MTRTKRLVALAVLLALLSAACGRDEGRDGGGSGAGDGAATTGSGEQAAGPADPSKCSSYDPTAGITDESIKIGSSLPRSGLYQAFDAIRKGYEAYFRYLNEEKGGVRGRRIEVVAKDDEYQTGKTVQNYQDLVRNEKVFALFNAVGTAHNLAIRDRQTRDCVPNLFVATGSQLWGNPARYPWTIGSIPTYPTEMAVLVEYLKETLPQAKIALLYQNDDFGKGYLTALEALVKGTDLKLAARQSYDPENVDVKGQVTTLKDSNADVFVIGATALACPNALGAKKELRWEPKVTYISATCTSGTIMSLVPPGAADGIYSAAYLMDPRDPQWAETEQMKKFRKIGAKYGLTATDLDNGLVGYGWTMAQLLEITLQKAPRLTRADVMNTAWKLSGETPGLLLPEVEVNTDGQQDPYPIESMRLAQYDGKLWQIQDKLYSFEGKTKEFSSLET